MRENSCHCWILGKTSEKRSNRSSSAVVDVSLPSVLQAHTVDAGACPWRHHTVCWKTVVKCDHRPWE